MNRLKKFFMVAIIFSSIPIALAGCGSSNNSGAISVKESAVSKLSADESYVYKSIIGSITSFKDPSSVTLISASPQAIIGRYCRISAKNSLGGLVTNMYRCTGTSLVAGEISNYSVDTSISPGKVNNALKEYKTSQGWL